MISRNQMSQIIADYFYVDDMIHIITVNSMVFEDMLYISGIWPHSSNI